MSLYNKTQEETDANFADSMLDKIRDLLVDHNRKTGMNIPTEYDLELSDTQRLAFSKFRSGESMLILGSAGTGKSRLIKEFQKFIEKNDTGKTMYVTSTTGISAYNIGGITINSFMGIGTGDAPVEVLLKRLRYKMGIKDRIRRTDILVIDEISMMSAALFEKIHIIFQTLRKSRRPFGGVQLVLTGDFLQLETVFSNPDADNRFVIESELFNKMFDKSIVILKENFRQRSDNNYIDILMRIRRSEHNDTDISQLNQRLLKRGEQKGDVVHLVSSNWKAQQINSKRLGSIDSPESYYETVYVKTGDSETCELLQRELQSQFSQRGIETVTLRKGCRVLLIKNLDVANGLVNGSIGTVEDLFMDAVRVKFDNGVTQIINRVEWEIELDNAKVVLQQIPLMLSYSITIHKSQSLSLDNAVLDLADCFCNHMVYVALSRVRSLSGLYLKSFDPKKITVNEKLLQFINKIENHNLCKIEM
jgi:ATP-dependent DNA helicase PIF1